MLKTKPLHALLIDSVMGLSALATLATLGCQPSFAESVDFAPPYSVSQKDPSLSDLLGPEGQNSLCVPTTLANIVADQEAWRSPRYSNLKLVVNPEQGGFTEQVRYFSQHCGTDSVQGTLTSNLGNCVREFYRQSGYSNGWAYLIGTDESADPTSVAFWHGPRSLNIGDLRYYLSNHVGVLMTVEWESESSNSYGPGNGWSAHGGHSFMLAGYDYDPSWGNDQITLKVVNPEMSYTDGDASNHFDSISMTSVNASDVDFPPGFDYVLQGNGFSSGQKRGYVKHVLVFLPDMSVSPRVHY